MSVTATKARTIRDVLNTSKTGEMADAQAKVRMGDVLCPMKYTIAALASTVAVDITSAAVAAVATHGTYSPALNIPDDDTRLPAALGIFTLRVTAGAAAAGPRQITDAGGTPSATVATLSDDGKTITFEAGVTGFVIEYLPRSANNLLDVFAPQT